MPDSKWEEAKRCPKCARAGVETGVRPGPSRSKIHTFTCENELCLTVGQGWLVQVLSDGSIPERTKGPKQFPALTPGQETAARDRLREVASNPDIRL